MTSRTDMIRVLLVEARPTDIALLSHLLEQTADPLIETVVAQTGEEAIRRIASESFDAILLDHDLPDRTGLEVLKEANRETRRPVIVLTAQSDQRTVVEFFHAGAYNYLRKNYDRAFAENLRLILRELLARRGLEQQIERERESREAILESLIQMVCYVDLDLRIRGANRAFRAMFHRFRNPDGPAPFAEEDPMGLSIPELLPPTEKWSRRLDMLLSVIESSQPIQDEIEVVVDGTTRVFWISASPLRVGNVTEGVVLSFTDMTGERVTLHRQLQLARAVDASVEGVLITDPKGRIEYVNPAFTQMTGYTAAELLERRPHFLQFTVPKPHTGLAIRESLSRGEDWQGEVVNRRKDGSIYIADLTISPIRDDAGTLLGFASSGRDVTERKLFTDELIKAREAAEESLCAKDMFLATVSHELRTPLTSIIGFADLLLMQSDLSESGRTFADSILRAGRLLKQLISNILDYSRFAGGRFYLDLEPLPLRATLEEALEMVRSEATDRPFHFDVKISPGFPDTVLIDRMKVQQVLLNLVSNAVKYTDGGVISLSVDSLFQNTEQGTANGRGGEMLLFSVRDQGPGIPPEMKDRIFDAFVQLESGIARRRGGTGLGLAISRRLVELMGGTIWVDSNPHEGSCFYFTLPMASQETATSGPSAMTAVSAGGGPRLLLHRMDQGAIPGEAELSGWGYTITSTGSPEDLQESLEAGEPFACVVSGPVGLSQSLQQIAEVASLAGDRVAWFLFGRDPQGTALPLGRVVALGESLGPRAVVRLMRALDGFPPGRRKLFVDPEDPVGTCWAHETFDQRGLSVLAANDEEIARAVGIEDVAVLLLDFTREPSRALELCRRVADSVPRLVLAVRYPRNDRNGLSERIDAAWVAAASGFQERAPQRLRWILNALHTCASHGRAQTPPSFEGEMRTDPGTHSSLRRPDRPILVVEDDPENLDLICRMIESLDLPSRGAKSGVDALEIVRREMPSLVLMDIQMPGMDGYEVTRTMHRLTGREHLPVIAMTGHVGPEDRRRCHEAGCVDFLAKPIERGDLLRVLRRWLSPAATNEAAHEQGRSVSLRSGSGS